jgi:pimeloyl-ACP methyl ester carboxylesterase
MPKRLDTKLDGLVLIEPEVHGDERGFLVETYRDELWRQLGADIQTAQENHSRSGANILRGLHFQTSPGQAKLVRARLNGANLGADPGKIVSDLFATPPWDLPALLFADPAQGQKLLTAGLDFGSDAALTRFMVDNARRLGSAGKILFPIPNRRLSKRLYRLRAETLLVWGRADKLVPPVYAARWQEALPGARLAWIENAGHMLPLEQPAAVAGAVAKFLA